VKSDDIVAMGVLVAAGGLILDSLARHSTAGKEKHLHYDIGPAFENLKINGFIQTVEVRPGSVNFPPSPNLTFINTAELFDSNTGQTAEILFAPTEQAQKAEATEAEIANIRKHRGNVDPTRTTDGIFAVPNGQPVYKFNMPIVIGHIYQRKIVEHETWTDYVISDFTTGKMEKWEDHHPDDTPP